ncbi:hypothetical protein [Streptomyces aurantiogriseus]|uniref:hypothetical protein n=1 Tax=Streptomyces aurantiogriseus TaxID=66870 RepID=UPI00167365EB|nr:hypothetical protein [Streptomyces aurantiogriseus]
MDGDASNALNDHEIDWLEQSADLPHLIARVSELVLRLGYDPEELVTLPRGELDRRELAAYSAGWADVVAEQLPAIRRAYEERITAAYLQGQEDARTGRRPRRARRAEGEAGGDVIPLPYVQLLRPPSEVTRVEERGERERSVADGTPVPVNAPQQGGRSNGGRPVPERQEDERREDGHGGREGVGGEPGGSSGGSTDDASGDFLLSAREVREKRSAPSERRPVVRRNGRPSVPPLDRPGDAGAAGRDRGRRTEAAERSAQGPAEPAEPSEPSEPSEPPGAGGDERRRLSDMARALADELEGRAGGRRRNEQPGSPGSR